ncbi:hypothetical protein CEUSTIGMA_g2365.t1 [Chlamydomonas eustigma]|uniref:Uncharacterized protein n=1 Tax=Chlamydomonas eustigma TaxID=1157962 RepID=A0A250WW32_9CHLO|nr:hypothetical protein CEUSTIGMA_g2365.t1 [Chlamydomonas eustigma]|eukprot:GAX74919.1 hypothetical protein CEUSTIGMA_g2365.t1 [Chlamydomonas eustigma]
MEPAKLQVQRFSSATSPAVVWMKKSFYLRNCCFEPLVEESAHCPSPSRRPKPLQDDEACSELVESSTADQQALYLGDIAHADTRTSSVASSRGSFPSFISTRSFFTNAFEKSSGILSNLSAQTSLRAGKAGNLVGAYSLRTGRSTTILGDVHSSRHTKSPNDSPLGMDQLSRRSSAHLQAQHSEFLSPKLAKSRAVKLLMLREASNIEGSPFSRRKSRILPDPEYDSNLGAGGDVESKNMNVKSRPLPRRAFSNDTRRKYPEERENRSPPRAYSNVLRTKAVNKSGENMECRANSNQSNQRKEGDRVFPRRAFSNENTSKLPDDRSCLQEEALVTIQNRSMSES